MAITKASILTFVNAAFSAAKTGSDLDIYIQEALDDLSKMHGLKDEDTTQTLVSGTTYLDYPDDALDTDQAIITVELTDSSSVRQGSLRRLRGGWDEYIRLMRHVGSSSRTLPTHMLTHDAKIYLYPIPGAAYTSSIWYYKLHQAIDSGVEFRDTWAKAIKYGACYYYSLLSASSEYISLWEGRFLVEKENMRRTISRELMIEGS